jgi:predicted CXXCH cytochrome family protein
MLAQTEAICGTRLASLAVLLALGTSSRPAQAQSPADLLNTKHNLSTSGPGPIRAQSETRICVFCHTPHNGTPASPLWNKALDPQVYNVYTSPTLKSGPLGQPTGPTKLCLSCHDGTIAMGAVVNPAGGISMAGSDHLGAGSLSDFGVDLSGHHPVAFAYNNALPNPELAPTPPSDLVFGGADEVHCMTCHDPHNDQYGRFLSKDNKYSALCTTCHQLAAWPGSAHATSTASVTGILPRAPKVWPAYTQLNEWGCEACHTPHFAPTPEQLLNFTTAPPSPFSCTTAGCHAGAPGGGPHGVLPAGPQGQPLADIAVQVRKVSAHHEQPGVVSSRPARGARGRNRTVSCADCHNPHEVADRPAQAPYASGMLQGASGVDRSGAEVRSVRFEYEVCFKCHGDNNPDLDFVPRVVTSTNLRLSFATFNPSYHPVVGTARGANVPSIPSSLAPEMTATATIYCTSCHADDEGGSRGPHGSTFAPILKERYETADGTVEGYESYALCYRCHERSSILADVSFRRSVSRTTASGGGHSGHLLAGTPCSACHDAHGVNVAQAGLVDATGSHTHLINFDTRVVQPKPGSQYPVFVDKGNFSGTCALVCHGVVHDNTSYP